MRRNNTQRKCIKKNQNLNPPRAALTIFFFLKRCDRVSLFCSLVAWTICAVHTYRLMIWLLCATIHEKTQKIQLKHTRVRYHSNSIKSIWLLLVAMPRINVKYTEHMPVLGLNRIQLKIDSNSMCSFKNIVDYSTKIRCTLHILRHSVSRHTTSYIVHIHCRVDAHLPEKLFMLQMFEWRKSCNGTRRNYNRKQYS